MIASIVLLIIFSNAALAWHPCFGDNENEGICPDGNHCCFDVATGTTTCISGKNESLGQCCNDTDNTSTGCGDGFRCATHPTEGTICLRTVRDDQLPEILPRYRLCSLPDRALKEVYGLPTVPGIQSTAAYLSNFGALDSDHDDVKAFQKQIETAFIVIHGSGRNADDYLCCAEAAAAQALHHQSNKTTLIIAPWFLAPNDPVVNITNSTAKPLRWEEHGPIEHTWRYGSDSINRNISSYEVTDDIINILVSNPERFPSLKRIIVAGHSAGGQYAVRWALLSNVIPFTSTARHIPIRIVVANPKSFCWLDTRRMFHGTLRKPHEDAISICPTYNEWEWGFDNSTKSDERDPLYAPYKDRAIRQSGGVKAIIERFPDRDVIYLSGELDTLHNGECEDKLQGPNRRIRSTNFYQSLQEIYGRPVHRHFVVKGVHHDHCLMFNSPEGILALSDVEEETGKEKKSS